MIYFAILGFAFIVWLDFIPLLKGKNLAGCVTFCLIFIVAFFAIILLIIGMDVPSPIMAVERFFKSIGLSY